MPDKTPESVRATLRAQVLALHAELGRNPTSNELHRLGIWKAKKGGYPTLASLFKACGLSYRIMPAIHRGPRVHHMRGHIGNDNAASEERSIERLRWHNAANPYRRPAESDIAFLEERAFA